VANRLNDLGSYIQLSIAIILFAEPTGQLRHKSTPLDCTEQKTRLCMSPQTVYLS